MGKYINTIIHFLSLVLLTAECTMEPFTRPEKPSLNGEPVGTDIVLNHGSLVHTRSSDPDEDAVADVNLFIFNFEGKLEDCIFVRDSRISHNADGTSQLRVSLLRGMEYSILACANFGFAISGIGTEQDLLEYRYWMAYPDEYLGGVPMSGKTGKFKADGETVRIDMERLMSKVSLSIDRSRLSKGVTFNVRSVEVGNCPRSVSAFQESHALGGDDVFGHGFAKEGADVDDLNRSSEVGKSREIGVYLLENMQGNLLEGVRNDKDKLLDNKALQDVCSYIEIAAEYKSDTVYSPAGEYLKYRFYLGESPGNFDVRRNNHYHFTICPEGDGLNEDSWRVDKSGLVRYGQGTMEISPGKYIEGKAGDYIDIRVTLTPKGIPFSFDMEDLDFDKSNGIYDYQLHKDGLGVTLHLLKKGSGLITCGCGIPESDGALIVVVVD